MSKKEKLYKSIKNQPKDRSFKEFVSLLKSYNFIVDESLGKGSHCPVFHKEYPDLKWTLSKRKPMRIYHAKKVIVLIEEVIERENDS